MQRNLAAALLRSAEQSRSKEHSPSEVKQVALMLYSAATVHAQQQQQVEV